MAQTLEVLCVAHGDSGHMNPVLLLAEGLAGRGHQVRVSTFDWAAEKYEKKVQSFGGEFVGLPCAHTEKGMLEAAAKRGCVPFVIIREQMQLHLPAAVQAKRPDVIVADFTTFAAMDLARALRVPLVLNWPGPFEMLKSFGRFPDLSRLVALGGFAFTYTPLRPLHFVQIANQGQFGSICDLFMEHMVDSLVLVNSFWGLERAEPLEPSVKMTGPLAPAPGPTDLGTSHPELHAFLGAATEVVYVTMGSMVQLEEWMVQTIYHALKLVGCSVVWSLKADRQAFLPRRDDPAFFVSSWLPQPALLAHEKVVAVVSHCGWGGALELIQGGKPCAALPFFGDQPDNAVLLRKAGVAEVMGLLPSISFDSTGKTAYKPRSVKAEAAAKVIRRVIDDKKYLKAALRLKGLSSGPGLGREAACEHIEAAAAVGVGHLTDPARTRRLAQQTPAVLTLAACGLALAAIGLARRHLPGGTR